VRVETAASKNVWEREKYSTPDPDPRPAWSREDPPRRGSHAPMATHAAGRHAHAPWTDGDRSDVVARPPGLTPPACSFGTAAEALAPRAGMMSAAVRGRQGRPRPHRASPRPPRARGRQDPRRTRVVPPRGRAGSCGKRVSLSCGPFRKSAR
jgi:hypothetical protein